MKISLLISFVSLMFAACSGNVNNKVSDDSTAKDTNDDTTAVTSPVQLCFQRLEGTSNQDTTTLKLLIKGNDVTGDFSHIPYQKDSRKGTISGKRNGKIIKGLWSFMQEGMTDTMSIEFKLDGDRLLQKDYSVDPQTGRQYTNETSGYTMEYSKVECKD
jgi:hypothetical protein